MPKTLSARTHKPEHFFILGCQAKLPFPLPERVTVWKPSELNAAVPKAPNRAVFISYGQASTDALLKAGLDLKKGDRFDQLLTIQPPREACIPALLGLFKTVIGCGGTYRWLPLIELLKVITSDDAADRFIAGASDHEAETLALVRGNRETVVVPFSSFQPTGTGTEPNFHDISFTDYGHTVRLGDYEASTDAILYEADPEYRRQIKKERNKSEKSFGASLARLRYQKRLRRSDFAPLAAKTIARIERSESQQPHGKTLEIIVQHLGVPADQIETY